MMEVLSFSGIGQRENNEDYILSLELSPKCSIYTLADGMGGYHHGQLAASIVCESIVNYLFTNFHHYDNKELLQRAINIANEALHEKQIELNSKMGTTIAGALIEDNIAYLFWLGDVRIYHFHNQNLLFQSEDHSFINQIRKRGTISATDIERYGNIVTKALTGTSIKDFPIYEVDIKTGDDIILCSDGYWKKTSIIPLLNMTKSEFNNHNKEIGRTMDDNYSILKINFSENS